MGDDWELETYKRLLSLIGGQESGDKLERAKTLLREFNYFFPNAKTKFDALCVAYRIGF